MSLEAETKKQVNTSNFTINLASRNGTQLADFIAFCQKSPDFRFWQALSAWSEYDYIIAAQVYGGLGRDPNPADTFDTFSWEGRRHDSSTFLTEPEIH